MGRAGAGDAVQLGTEGGGLGYKAFAATKGESAEDPAESAKSSAGAVGGTSFWTTAERAGG